MDKRRCFWCNLKNPKYIEYHDCEWGVLRTDDEYLFEMLLLESFQAGLSWECVLNKRAAFADAFDNFDMHKIAEYGDDKIQALMQNKDIIRNKPKIIAAIRNAEIFIDITKQFGSFEAYLNGFTSGKTYFDYMSTTSPLSDAISGDLYARGMRFVGSTIIYSYLQAVGIINSHTPDCFLYKGTTNGK